MDPKRLLDLVNGIHLEKNIPKELVFQAIESALVTGAKKHFGEESDVVIQINRTDGSLSGSCNGEALDPETIGRIGAQTAKQVIIQKIREAERDALFDEYEEMKWSLINGTVQRNERSVTTVSLGNIEAILPRSEQIPGDSHHANERIRAVIFEVRKEGSRVKVLLSRTRPQLVQRLFEQEIPEIADGVITVKAISREPGYRSKVAVASSDSRVDCVGACVGVRGNRIKNIVEELANERIDIVRWNDDPQELIPNALQPAEVDEVILCKMIGKAIVMVREDQLSLAIGRRGQNVRLASKLCGWDIDIMTPEELQEQIDRAITGFSSLEGVTEELAERLVGEGYLSYDELSVIEPDDLMEMGELTAEQADVIISQAEVRAEDAERAAEEERRRQREAERQARVDEEETARLRAEGVVLPDLDSPEAESSQEDSGSESAEDGSSDSPSSEAPEEAAEAPKQPGPPEE